MVNGSDPLPLGTLKGMLAHRAVHTCQQWAGPEAPVIVPEGRGRLITIGADEEVQMEDILQGRPGSRKKQDAPKGAGSLHGGEAAAHGIIPDSLLVAGLRSSDVKALHTPCQQREGLHLTL